MVKRTCSSCKETKDITEYSSKGEGRYSSYCLRCDRERARKYRVEHGRAKECPVKAARRAVKYAAKEREDRASNKRLGGFVLADCRASDRKKGRTCDLDRAFVDEMVSLPCVYCGINAEHAKMTLDRIDNSLGHLKSNVVTACYRCNLIRGDMPHSAWIMIAPSVREASEAGAFGEWKLWPKKRKVTPTANAEIAARPIEPRPAKAEIAARPVEPHPAETSAGGRFQKISDQDFLAALHASPSICQALIKLGLAPKGKNYERAKRLLGIEGKMSRSNNNLIDIKK